MILSVVDAISGAHGAFHVATVDGVASTNIPANVAAPDTVAAFDAAAHVLCFDRDIGGDGRNDALFNDDFQDTAC